MQRLNSVNHELADGRTKELLDTVQQAFGLVPNTELDIPRAEPVAVCSTDAACSV